MMQIRFERTFEREPVRAIMTHPRIYPWISDDFYPPAEYFWPMENEAIHYLLAFDGDELLGVCITHPINTILWEAHHCLLPNAWGVRALAVGQALFEYLRKYTPCYRVIGFTPKDNTLACRFARKLGMEQVGINTDAFFKGGKLRDQIIFGKTIKEF